MPFEVEELTGDVSLIRAAGRLDMVSAPGLRSIVADALAAGRTRLVVDLSDVAVMDSSGLGALVGCLKAARHAEGDLRLARPSAQVVSVLRLTNLDRVLAIVDAPEAAYEC
jgi:anti-sigma B factor antagonist